MATLANATKTDLVAALSSAACIFLQLGLISPTNINVKLSSCALNLF